MNPASNFSKRPQKKNGKSSQSGVIRIIGGQWRGRKLKVHDKEGLRPTTDRLKETLFNWLMTDIRGAKVLDCFAGAGSLCFEAASRGATHVTAIEKDKLAANQLKTNGQVLNANDCVHIIQGDFFSVQKKLPGQFDLIFIDPPFHKGLVPNVIQALIETNSIAAGALIYLEQEGANRFELLSSDWGDRFQLIKDKSAGQVSAQLFKWVDSIE